MRKCPLDLWIYQELIHEIRPDWIIETGTAFGGSASYFASLCDVLGRGQTGDAGAHDHDPRATGATLGAVLGAVHGRGSGCPGT